ncbi:hypothetical protein MP228_002849 [Amoeboaphelidium protococcarum]|nr:hypothetical protein MP228_002849 [Amoeboaphelidium protococcarum]
MESVIKEQQVEKALRALIKHEKHVAAQQQESAGGKADLLPATKLVHLQISLKKVAIGYRPQPRVIDIPHPIYDVSDSDDCSITGQGTDGQICVFVKDPQTEYKQALLNIHHPDDKSKKLIQKVISVTKLKSKYSTYEAKRILADSYTIFLCDDKVATLLPSLLGTKFFKKRKFPMPVKVSAVVMKFLQAGENDKAYDYLYKNAYLSVPYYVPGTAESVGVISSLRVGHMVMDVEQMTQNVMHALPQLSKYISGGVDNIAAVHIKTQDSIGIPVYQAGVDSAEQDKQLTEKVAAENKKRKLAVFDRDDDLQVPEDAPQIVKDVAMQKKENRRTLKQLLRKIKVQVN